MTVWIIRGTYVNLFPGLDAKKIYEKSRCFIFSYSPCFHQTYREEIE